MLRCKEVKFLISDEETKVFTNFDQIVKLIVKKEKMLQSDRKYFRNSAERTISEKSWISQFSFAIWGCRSAMRLLYFSNDVNPETSKREDFWGRKREYLSDTNNETEEAGMPCFRLAGPRKIVKICVSLSFFC